MLYFLAGVSSLGAATLSSWYVRPVDGKLSPRISMFWEPYVAIVIVGFIIFGFGLLGLGVAGVIK